MCWLVLGAWHTLSVHWVPGLHSPVLVHCVPAHVSCTMAVLFWVAYNHEQSVHFCQLHSSRILPTLGPVLPTSSN
jgi:hypothetical protein